MALTVAQIAALKTANGNPSQYGDGTDSTVGEQFNLQSWIKDSLIEVAPKQWFTQIASTIEAPKHMGTKLVRYLYLPMLDDRNINDQGIDAAGVTIANGNMYGSSRDINTILKFQPHLTEMGGKVNRISFTRIKLEGSYEEYGFHYVYTDAQMQFDTDAELRQHNVREAMRGATKLMEDRLQIDLLNAARAVLYGGEATQRSELTGLGVTPSLVDYEGLINTSLMLDDLDAGVQSSIVTGSTYNDTRVLEEGRLLYIGTPVVTQLMKLVDFHGKAAYTESKFYASAGKLALGEHGAIAGFRVIKVGKDMAYYAASGAETGGLAGGYRASLDENGVEKFDVFPMLCVPPETFTTISFKGSKGGTNKFEYYDQPPKPKTGRSQDDPFGKVGFSALSWYYGFMPLRPEKILRIEVVAVK